MDILLTTINSRYQHSSFGLRYLYANLGDLQPRTKIIEFVLGKNARDIVEALLQQKPKIIGIGVYIWNTTVVYEVVSLLKKVAPEIIVVLGGPEISHETEAQALYKIADFVIKGEGDFLFKELCESLLVRKDSLQTRLITGALPEISKIQLPYSFYTDQDIANRVIYVEASRGCPYKCEYCLSSLDLTVRNFNVDIFLNEMKKLIERGVRQFKFVDRTFNLSPTISTKILNFFFEQIDLGLFLHFEMVPDRLPEELKELISKFPAGSLQFEVGVQTWNPKVARNVSRRQDYVKIVENFRFLKEHTGVHTHADLIIGLPGESLESFAQGLNELSKCEPDEIQLGILKRLRGTPISRHDELFQMVYSEQPPFQLLQNKDLDYLVMQKFNRFAQFWDLYANSGNFPQMMKYFKSEGIEKFGQSLFHLFWNFSDFLTDRHGQAHAISLTNLTQSAQIYLEKSFQLNEFQIKDLTVLRRAKKETPVRGATPTRQQKHLSENH